MKKKVVLLSSILFAFTFKGFSQAINPAVWQSLTSYWSFDNTQNLTQATKGQNLILEGTHTAIAGPMSGDGAVTIGGTGNSYKVRHGLAKVGNDLLVNKFSLVIDFRVPQLGKWYCFYQTSPNNSNDGDAFINTSGNIGVGQTGYSYSKVKVNEWYRLVISADLGSSYKYYLDGQLLQDGDAQDKDGRFALDSIFYFINDEDGENNLIDIAALGVFNKALSDNEVFALGGYGHVIDKEPSLGTAGMNPYLQTPTPSSIYVSWHSIDTTVMPVVRFGTDSTRLNNVLSGTYENIKERIWHTVKLTNLTPNTTYYYRSISGKDSTGIYPFKTPAAQGTPGQHLRFVVLGDSRTDITRATQQISKLKHKLQSKYGMDWYNQISLIAHVGDIVTSGGSIAQYTDEFFNPFSEISCSVPTMISIGNHEGESSIYYKYMKYEELSSNAFASPHPYNERFYSFNLANTQFLFCNGNWQMRNSAQKGWIEDALRESEGNSKIDFVFSFTHQPGHSEIWPDGNETFVQEDILGHLKNFYKASIHFSGHSHNYERGVIPMSNSDAKLQHDMREVLSGGAGSSLDRWGMYSNQTDYPEVQYSRDHYCYVIIDIDVDNKSYTAETYSFGHDDKELDNVLIDKFYRSINQTKPEKPILAGVINSDKLTFVTNKMEGVDSIMTTQFQVTNFPEIYASPIVDELRDYQNIYGDKGAPDYEPIDKNAGIDLYRLSVNKSTLTLGQEHGFRVRFRDHNLRWSDWSEEMKFTPIAGSATPAADFAANKTNIPVDTKVSFSDLSNVTATSWDWDLNGDGVTDSKAKYPEFTYTTNGSYDITLTINKGIAGELSITKANYIVVKSITGIESLSKNQLKLTVYPNPIQTSTTISFTLQEKTNITVSILDINGKLIKTLANTVLKGGENKLVWDGTNSTGQAVSNGQYFIKLSGEHINISESVVLMK